jgi:hypothetical protein
MVVVYCAGVTILHLLLHVATIYGCKAGKAAAAAAVAA